MSLTAVTGILLDVSASMRRNIGSGIDANVGQWAPSMFKFIDDLIKHVVPSENRVFAIGVGAKSPSEIFDIIGTLQKIGDIDINSYERNAPATTDRINKIIAFLETNGAYCISKWVQDISFIQDEVSDYMAALFLKELESNEGYRRTFIDKFLVLISPGSTFPMIATWFKFIRRVPITGATRDQIRELVDQAKRYFLKDVGRHSVYSVQDASRFIRKCFNENEVSTEQIKKLLENVEPFISGKTPLCRSLENAARLFGRDDSGNFKSLFVLSDGRPTDATFETSIIQRGISNLKERRRRESNVKSGKIEPSDDEPPDDFNEDNDRFKQVTSRLKKAGVKVVSCFVSASENIQPKRLYDQTQSGWELGAKLMFSLSSHVPTQHLPRAILAKRGWEIDIVNNETKLFVQVNHPENLREVCDVAKNVICSAQALFELVVSVYFDIKISLTNCSFIPKDQGEDKTCYAFACGTVLHLAMKRIHNRDGGPPEFEELKDKMIRKYGKNKAPTETVLTEMCKEYRLHYHSVSIEDAKKAISEKRPVIARIALTKKEWAAFQRFYKAKPTGILTRKRLGIRKPCPSSDLIWHSVVLISYNSECLTFMDSEGVELTDNGFFRVENTEVLGDKVRFLDVYWNLDDLSEKEKESYRKSDSEVAAKLIGLLKGLEFAKCACPECQRESLVTEFTGTLCKARCPKCFHEFSTNDNKGNILALNIYLMFLSRCRSDP